MSQINIQAAEKSILKVFSDDFFFTIPQFQRPYAWTTVQAEELFDDLLSFIEGEVEVNKLPPYFLGSIVLVKGIEANSEVIDGQQRLITLTILLSALRKLVPPEFANSITSYLYQKADPVADIPDRYRLMLRNRDKEFFQKYIQHEGGIEQLEALDPVHLSDSQKNIRENALLYLRRLRGEVPEARRAFLARAIVNRCFLVVVSTPNFDSAYRIFSILNGRGLNLSHADILKAQAIGAMPEQDRDMYTKKWEDIEVELGREAFQGLFAHIRMIYRRAKPQGTLLKEFRDNVWPGPTEKMRKAQWLIDEVIIPCAEAFASIKDMDYESIRLAEQVNGLFKWLNQIDNSDWLPPAILYLSKNKNQPELLVRFFADLERLAAALMLLRANVNKRIERYGRLLTAIENNDDLFASNSPLQLTDREQKEIVQALDGDLYGSWYCRYVLLRLDEAIGDGAATFNYPIISIEHVLQQSPAPNSIWVSLFADKEKREEYVHRLGNLVLLSRKKNAAAQNYDFDKKKKLYFSTGGVASFRLTTQVIHEEKWTPEVIERRQRELLAKLKEIWRLD